MKFVPRIFIVVVATFSILVGALFSETNSWALVSPSSGTINGGTSVTVDGISFVSVHTGENFVVGLTSEGTLYSWGTNQYGQLGTGNTTATTTPKPVVDAQGTGILQGVTQVSTGFYHVIAITSDGVYAWGNNQDGQLGNGSTSQQPNPLPVRVAGPSSGYLQHVTKVVAGGFFSLALIDGNVYAWGQNNFGQLGDNTNIDRNVPTHVVGVGGSGFLSGITDIDAGPAHNLASTGAALYSWGVNSSGQLGVGTTSSSAVPLQVLGPNGNGFLAGIDQISAGNTHSLALVAGSVYSWGWNMEGMLGTANTTDSYVPISVLDVSGNAPLTGVTSIGTGSYNSFATLATGLYVWGSNSAGALCQGIPGNQFPFATLPVLILAETGSGPLENIVAYSAGNRVTSIVTTSGIVTCGDNHYGQFGNGTLVDSNRVVQGPHFEQLGVMIGQNHATNIQVSEGNLIATTPPGAAGVVRVTGTANVYGGSVAASPAEVSWDAGTFTYEPELAATGLPSFWFWAALSLTALLGGCVILMLLRRKE